MREALIHSSTHRSAFYSCFQSHPLFSSYLYSLHWYVFTIFTLTNALRHAHFTGMITLEKKKTLFCFWELSYIRSNTKYQVWNCLQFLRDPILCVSCWHITKGLVSDMDLTAFIFILLLRILLPNPFYPFQNDSLTNYQIYFQQCMCDTWIKIDRFIVHVSNTTTGNGHIDCFHYLWAKHDGRYLKTNRSLNQKFWDGVLDLNHEFHPKKRDIQENNCDTVAI